MDAIDSVVDPLREFAKDSVRLVKRCHKPDRKGEPYNLQIYSSPIRSIEFEDLSSLLCLVSLFLA